MLTLRAPGSRDGCTQHRAPARAVRAPRHLRQDRAPGGGQEALQEEEPRGERELGSLLQPPGQVPLLRSTKKVKPKQEELQQQTCWR